MIIKSHKNSMLICIIKIRWKLSHSHPRQLMKLADLINLKSHETAAATISLSFTPRAVLSQIRKRGAGNKRGGVCESFWCRGQPCRDLCSRAKWRFYFCRSRGTFRMQSTQQLSLLPHEIETRWENRFSHRWKCFLLSSSLLRLFLIFHLPQNVPRQFGTL